MCRNGLSFHKPSFLERLGAKVDIFDEGISRKNGLTNKKGHELCPFFKPF